MGWQIGENLEFSPIVANFCRKRFLFLMYKEKERYDLKHTQIWTKSDDGKTVKIAVTTDMLIQVDHLSST